MRVWEKEGELELSVCLFLRWGTSEQEIEFFYCLNLTIQAVVSKLIHLTHTTRTQPTHTHL
jgi:hypothetical protein